MTALTAYKFDTPDGAGKMLDLVQDLVKAAADYIGRCCYGFLARGQEEA